MVRRRGRCRARMRMCGPGAADRDVGPGGRTRPVWHDRLLRTMTPSNSDSDDFWKALRTGVLLGGAALVIALPAYYYWKQAPATTSPGQPPQAQVQAPAAVPPQRPVKLASFGDTHPTDAVRQ